MPPTSAGSRSKSPAAVGCEEPLAALSAAARRLLASLPRLTRLELGAESLLAPRVRQALLEGRPAVQLSLISGDRERGRQQQQRRRRRRRAGRGLSRQLVHSLPPLIVTDRGLFMLRLTCIRAGAQLHCAQRDDQLALRHPPAAAAAAQRCTGMRPPSISRDLQIELCHSPAQIGRA